MFGRFDKDTYSREHLSAVRRRRAQTRARTRLWRSRCDSADFSGAMLKVARRRHTGNAKLRFILVEAENPREPDLCDRLPPLEPTGKLAPLLQVASFSDI